MPDSQQTDRADFQILQTYEYLRTAIAETAYAELDRVPGLDKWAEETANRIADQVLMHLDADARITVSYDEAHILADAYFGGEPDKLDQAEPIIRRLVEQTEAALLPIVPPFGPFGFVAGLSWRRVHDRRSYCRPSIAIHGQSCLGTPTSPRAQTEEQANALAKRAMESLRRPLAFENPRTP